MAPSRTVLPSIVSRPTNGKLCTGQLVGITRDGKPLVDIPGNLWGPVEARVAVMFECPEVAQGHELPVLLFVDDPGAPIIMGVIRDNVLPRQASAERAAAELTAPKGARSIEVDGKAVHIDAAEEIVLRCGESSLLLRRDGKIVLRGAEIISRATETNKIKGSIVKIN